MLHRNIMFAFICIMFVADVQAKLKETTISATQTVKEEKMTTIEPGIYQHYRGNLYQVIGMARHSETLEELVVYQQLYGDYGLWVRPYKMFTEMVEHEGKQVLRFKFIKPALSLSPTLRP